MHDSNTSSASPLASFCRPLFALAMVGLWGCGNSSSESTARSTADFRPVLQATVTDVILPTYAAMAEDATLLHTLCTTLASDADLDKAREQWLKTRRHWERGEAFLYGPVADKGFDPALDSWPVDRVQLDQVLASQLPLSADTIDSNLGGGLKGFHTIEYLLFGVDQKKTFAQLSAAPRQIEYLAGAAVVLRDDARDLYLAWAPDGEDFGTTFYLSGNPGGKYYSSADALHEVLNGCADIADEVANGKLADPYKEQNPELVESQFAHSSLSDFADNIRSIQTVYQGAGSASSVSALVAATDSALDGRVRAAIAEAIDAILAISPSNDPPFARAISDPSRASLIETAQAKVRKLSTLFLGEVPSVVLR